MSLSRLRGRPRRARGAQRAGSWPPSFVCSPFVLGWFALLRLLLLPSLLVVVVLLPSVPSFSVLALSLLLSTFAVASFVLLCFLLSSLCVPLLLGLLLRPGDPALGLLESSTSHSGSTFLPDEEISPFLLGGCLSLCFEKVSVSFHGSSKVSITSHACSLTVPCLFKIIPRHYTGTLRQKLLQTRH